MCIRDRGVDDEEKPGVGVKLRLNGQQGGVKLGIEKYQQIVEQPAQHGTDAVGRGFARQFFKYTHRSLPRVVSAG